MTPISGKALGVALATTECLAGPGRKCWRESERREVFIALMDNGMIHHRSTMASFEKAYKSVWSKYIKGAPLNLSSIWKSTRCGIRLSYSYGDDDRVGLCNSREVLRRTARRES